MKNLTFTHEGTFETEEVPFDTEQIEIMNDIKKYIENRLKDSLYPPTSLLVCEDKKSLAFSFNTSKERGVKAFDHKFVVKLTKLNNV